KQPDSKHVGLSPLSRYSPSSDLTAVGSTASSAKAIPPDATGPLQRDAPLTACLSFARDRLVSSHSSASADVGYPNQPKSNWSRKKVNAIIVNWSMQQK